MDDPFDGEDITTLGEVAEAIITMRQDYADLDAANVKLGMDLIHARFEIEELKKKLNCKECSEWHSWDHVI